MFAFDSHRVAGINDSPALGNHKNLRRYRRRDKGQIMANAASNSVTLRRDGDSTLCERFVKDFT